MTDRDRIDAMIQGAVSDLYPYWSIVIADHLIANGVTIQQWIPLEERLPEPFENVLLYDSTEKRVEYGCMDYHKEWYGVVMSHTITHWMPLPQPPREDE